MHPDGSHIPVVWWSGTEEKGVYLEGFLSGRCCSTNQEHLSTSFGATVGFPSVSVWGGTPWRGIQQAGSMPEFGSTY